MDLIEIRKFFFYKNECDARILMWHLSYARSDVVFFIPYVFQISRWHIHCTSQSVSELDTTFFTWKKFKTVFEFTKKKNITVYCIHFSVLSWKSADARFLISIYSQEFTIHKSPASQLICQSTNSTLVVSNTVSLTVGLSTQYIDHPV